MSEQDRSRGFQGLEAEEFGYGRGRGRGRDPRHRDSGEVYDSRTPAPVPVDPDSGKRARTGGSERPSSSGHHHGSEGHRNCPYETPGSSGEGQTSGGNENQRNANEVSTPSEAREGRRGARRGQREERNPNDRFDFVQIRTPENRGTKSKQGTTTPVNSVELMANFFPLVKQPNWCLYNYRVDFKPEEDNTRMKKILLGVHRETLGAYIFDGSTMYTINRLDPDPMVLTSTRNWDHTEIELTIRRVGEIPPTDFTYLQFYNIIVRKCMETLKFEEIGRRFYDRAAAISMPHHRLELWPGYVTSIRQFEHNVMMCVDVIHKVLRHDTCLSIILLHTNNDGVINQEAVAKKLIDCIVMTHYNRKTYRIDDIAWDKSPADTFDMRGKDTTYHDYYASHHKVHIRDMRQPLLVSRPKKRDTHRGQTDSIYLIPEFCQMTGLSDETRSDFRVMNELAKHLHQPPDVRFENVQNFMKRIKGSEEIRNELATWGLDFGAKLIKLTGRVAPSENIIMKVNNENEMITATIDADWKEAIKKTNMFSVKPMREWVIVAPQSVVHIDALLQKMGQAGRGLGFTVTPPQVFRINDTRPQVTLGYMRCLAQVRSTFGNNLKMIFVILPRNKLDLYKAVKKYCCLDYGIPSQCFLAKNVTNDHKVFSIATKVVIQMNAKLGGEPWAVLNPFKQSRLMIIGFDVHHCGKGKGPSVGGMVATTNSDLSTFYSTVSFHENHEELSGNLCKDITKCLMAYRKLNQNQLPGRIIMYRDGVGDGQLNHVFNTELAQIKVSLEGSYSSAQQEQPKFTLIIVTKKINARIARMSDKTEDDNRQGYNRPPDNRQGYNRPPDNRQDYNRPPDNRQDYNRQPDNRQGYNRQPDNRQDYNRQGYNRQPDNRPQLDSEFSCLKNPKAGTIVDDIITLPERWDFYLISQNANQGTVSPTAYNVIFDQQGLTADRIQTLTYRLTHMYYNWSGTVSVPAVCQYAHKLAYLTGVVLGAAAPEHLAYTLYYL